MLPGEDPRAAQVTAALAEADAAQALREAGVRWVLVEKPVPPAYDAPPGTVVHDGRWLTLVDLGPAAQVADPRAGGAARTTVILVADAVAVVGTLRGNRHVCASQGLCSLRSDWRVTNRRGLFLGGNL